MLGFLSITCIALTYSLQCTDFKEYDGCEPFQLARIAQKPSFLSKDILFAPQGFNDVVLDTPTDDKFVGDDTLFFIADSGSHATCLSTKFVASMHRKNHAFGMVSPQFVYPGFYGDRYYLTFYANMWIKLKSIAVLFPVLIGCPGVVEDMFFTHNFAGIIGDDLMSALNTSYRAGVSMVEIPYPPNKRLFIHYWKHPITNDTHVIPYKFPIIDIYTWYAHECKVDVEISEAFWSKPFYFAKLPYIITKRQMRVLMMVVMRREAIKFEGSWRTPPQAFTVTDDEITFAEEQKLFENVLSKITPKKPSPSDATFTYMFDYRDAVAHRGYDMTDDEKKEFAKMMVGTTEQKASNTSKRRRIPL